MVETGAEALKLRFIEPMYADATNELPEGEEWLYEVKLDGYRALAGRDSSGVSLWSRRENSFTTQFPAIARACESLEPGTLLDGEIVAIDESGARRLTCSNITAQKPVPSSSTPLTYLSIAAGVY